MSMKRFVCLFAALCLLLGACSAFAQEDLPYAGTTVVWLERDCATMAFDIDSMAI